MVQEVSIVWLYTIKIGNNSDCCVYYRVLGDGSHILLMLYVDYMLIAAKCKDEVDMLKSLLSNKFDMKKIKSCQEDSGYGDEER